MSNKEKPHGLTKYLPILSWLPNYNRAWLTADIIAGLTLFGTARHLNVAGTSATSVLIASTVVALGVSTGDMETSQAWSPGDKNFGAMPASQNYFAQLKFNDKPL